MPNTQVLASCPACGAPLAEPRRVHLTASQRFRIAAEAIIDPRTVKRAYSGARCTSTMHALICRTAMQLGLPLPPDQLPSEH